MGMGFPMGTGIPWESHGNGNKTRNWEWEWEGMGNHLVRMGITCTPMGIYSQRFYAGLKLVSAGSGECRDTNVDLCNKMKSNGHR